MSDERKETGGDDASRREPRWVYVVLLYSGAYSSYSESVCAVCTDLRRAKECAVEALREWRITALTDWKEEGNGKWQIGQRSPRDFDAVGCYVEQHELDERPTSPQGEVEESPIVPRSEGQK